MKKHSIRILSLAAYLAAMLAPASAQSVNATLRGAVRDPSGAVISGAAITITNLEKGVSRQLSTTESGEFVALQLPPQNYKVAASAPDFKTRVIDSFVLQVGQEARLDFVLELGAASEQVVVTAAAPAMQTETASNSGVVDERSVEELPLNGRAFYDLAQLVPNVTNPASGSTLSARGGFNVAGSSEVTNNFVLDGIDNNDRTTGQPSVRPSVDGIQEFRILTGIYPAEYGRQSGGQVIVTTKSGTNQLHGSLYEFYRNSRVDARGFFSPATIPAFNRNNYGGSFGAPIRKNKTFLFATYEGLRNQTVNATRSTVPTQAQRDGDLSASAAIVYPGIVNNRIPQSLIVPQAIRILSYYPLPNLSTATGSLNYVNSTPSRTPQDQFSLRGDHVITERNNLTLSYQFFNYFVYTPSAVPGFSTQDKQRSQQAVIRDTHIFTPNLINELRLGYNRYAGLRSNEDNQLGNVVNQLGIPQGGSYGVQPTGSENGGLPSISITGFNGIGGGVPQWRGDNTINLVDSLTYVHGRHTVKVGADYQNFYKHSYYDSGAKGSFSFNGQYTGNAFADFLLGDLRSTSRTTGDPNQHPYTKSADFYAQDDWKVLRRLTLNFGLRYELNLPQKERTNKLSQFDLTTGLLNSGDGTVYNVSSATGLLVPVGTKNIGDTLYQTPTKNFAPRFGFAYRATGDNKTVLRGGYGIFYDQVVVGNGLFTLYGLGAPYNSSFTTTNTATATYATWANPFPAGVAGGSVSPGAVDPHYPTSYTQQWSFAVQRELVRNFFLDVTYQGSHGIHQPIGYNANQAAIGPGTIQSKRPYPQWANVTYSDAIGFSTFNSLVAKVERRYTNGLSVQSSLVYSKTLDLQSLQSTGAGGDGGIRNARDIKSEYGRASIDARLRSVSSYVYRLPFGRGRAWLASAPAWLDAFAGGWEATGILTLQTGRPFTVTTSKDLANNGGGSRPIVVGDPRLAKPTVNQWFNPAAFTDVIPAGTYTYGNEGRNILDAPGLFNFDVGFYKNFSLRERFNVQFRAESFNALNHANFSAPGANISSANVGQIASTAAPNRTIQFALKLRY
jgi:hypothetical protein